MVVMHMGRVSWLFTPYQLRDEEAQSDKGAPNQQGLHDLLTHLIWLELLARKEPLVQDSKYVRGNAVDRDRHHTG